MANEKARGRPMAALVLSAEERGYLERQVRERCRIVLRCPADQMEWLQCLCRDGLAASCLGCARTSPRARKPCRGSETAVQALQGTVAFRTAGRFETRFHTQPPV
jgi:hypothetical protein